MRCELLVAERFIGHPGTGHDLAQIGIWQTEYAALPHRGQAQQHVLDFAGIDVDAAPNDHVLGPATQIHIAIGVTLGEMDKYGVAIGMISCEGELNQQALTRYPEALDQLESHRFAAAVINHVLQDQTGLELIRTIRSERARDPLRLVLLGALPSPQLIGAVVSDCVVKPLHADRLHIGRAHV